MCSTLVASSAIRNSHFVTQALIQSTPMLAHLWCLFYIGFQSPSAHPLPQSQASGPGCIKRHVNVPVYLQGGPPNSMLCRNPNSRELRCGVNDRYCGASCVRGPPFWFRTLNKSRVIDLCHPLVQIIDLDRPWVSNLLSILGSSSPCVPLPVLPSLFVLALVISCSVGKSCLLFVDCSSHIAS